jgi:predicted DNA-binding transcriptional regulator YafY
MLAVERFMNLELNKEIFPDPGIDSGTLLEKAFTVTWDDPIRAVIRFDASSAPYVKARQWAPDQVFTDNPDGSTVLTMETSGFHDVLHWVLGFGAAAKVLEPESLVMGVRGQLKEMTARYESPD